MFVAENQSAPFVTIDQLSFRYGPRAVLENISLKISAGEIFGWLGPNGSGKTTLFRILATLLPVPPRCVTIGGYDLSRQATSVRQLLGVCFQSPALDRKLTVEENLRCQAALYGLSGSVLHQRLEEASRWWGLSDRWHQRVEGLSGGWQRRTELAKALLHRPRLLLLDEPSTGLDPRARSELWEQLQRLRHDTGTTILLTTHWMEEAERCDRLALLDQGQIVAVDAPHQLRAQVGTLKLHCRFVEGAPVQAAFEQQWGVALQRTPDHGFTITDPRVGDMASWLLATHREQLLELWLSRATLEDVFLARTGHSLSVPQLSTASTAER
ncbi:MAG: ABC transporter ATP-binding protein [Planctomycetaceae bacterium]|nr:MAG: ABC transporter ATP-binding protein [Planctomycetaceae bacterium]